jgi:hypothetical protein
MGYTRRNAFHGGVDTFITGLTTVFTADSLEDDLKNHFRYWLKIPLQGNGFYYNATSEQNLVVEFSFGNTPWVRNYFVVVDSVGGGAFQMAAGYRDSAIVRQHRVTEQGVGVSGSVDFGFDLVPGPPQGVAAASEASGLLIYPNPSNGRFRLSTDVPLPLGGAGLTVSNSRGQQVYVKQYPDDASGSSLPAEIDLSGAPKGVYFLELTNGGRQVLTRRIVIE